MTKVFMQQDNTIAYTDSPAIRGREDRYTRVTVDTAKILKGWRDSLFSFEWLNQDGSLRKPEALSPSDLEKRRGIEAALSKGLPVDRPVLGIGILDNIEIGAGRTVFLTLAANGHRAIEVHIPKSCVADFKNFLA